MANVTLDKVFDNYNVQNAGFSRPFVSRRAQCPPPLGFAKGGIFKPLQKTSSHTFFAYKICLSSTYCIDINSIEIKCVYHLLFT